MVEWQRLQERQADWLNPSGEAIERRRKFLRRSLSRELAHYARAVQTLRHGRARIALGYADMFTDQMELDSSVATTSNLERLLELAARPGANGAPDRQRWFEAISRFDQSIAVAQFEMQDSLESLDRDMNDLLDFLNDRFFQDGFHKIEVYCYHDPKQSYTVRSEDIGVGHHLSRPHLVRRKSDLTCRKTVWNQLAYIRHRIKDPFDAWLKTQRQVHNPEIAQPYVMHDRRGLLFIVESEQVLHEVAIRLVECLVEDGAKEIEQLVTNFGSAKGVDAQNKHSSASYKAAKTLVCWRDQVFELQFQTYRDYFTSKRSLTDANHELYRLKQALDYFLPLLWPKEIYDVDWANPNVRHALKTWKESQLGWRVNGTHPV